MPNGHLNNSPESGRGLGHVTPTIFDIRSNISLKLLELETSNLVCSFVLSMPSRRINNFPWKWAWPRSLDPYNFGSTVGYPSDSLASCRYIYALSSKTVCFYPPHLCLTPPSGGTPYDVNAIYTAKRTFNGLQYRCWQYGSILIRLAVVASQICEISRNFL